MKTYEAVFGREQIAFKELRFIGKGKIHAGEQHLQIEGNKRLTSFTGEGFNFLQPLIELFTTKATSKIPYENIYKAVPSEKLSYDSNVELGIELNAKRADLRLYSLILFIFGTFLLCLLFLYVYAIRFKGAGQTANTTALIIGVATIFVIGGGILLGHLGRRKKRNIRFPIKIKNDEASLVSQRLIE